MLTVIAKEYRLIVEDTPEKLSSQINVWLYAGWVLHGLTFSHNGRFGQAVIRTFGA